MTYKFLKTAIFSISALALIVISSCTKSLPGRTDFTQTSDFVILNNGTSSKLQAYNRGSDTISLTVIADLASATNPSSPVTVTIGADDAAITAYNAANSSNYVALPAANYKLVATTLTIPAGQHYAQTTLQVYTKGLDPATSYMTAISIKDASGKQLSSNLNTLYFNTIGNPLAGVYNWLGQRWNSAAGLDTTKAPASTPANNISASISPLGPTTLYFPNVYLKQNGVDAGPALSFTNNAGVLSNFSASTNNGANITAVGFSLVTAPVLVGYTIVGTAATKYVGSVFRFYAVIDNGAGGQRATIDTFTKIQ